MTRRRQAVVVAAGFDTALRAVLEASPGRALTKAENRA